MKKRMCEVGAINKLYKTCHTPPRTGHGATLMYFTVGSIFMRCQCMYTFFLSTKYNYFLVKQKKSSEGIKKRKRKYIYC